MIASVLFLCVSSLFVLFFTLFLAMLFVRQEEAKVLPLHCLLYGEIAKDGKMGSKLSLISIFDEN